jgi:NADPH2:quinone reductase
MGGGRIVGEEPHVERRMAGQSEGVNALARIVQQPLPSDKSSHRTMEFPRPVTICCSVPDTRVRRMRTVQLASFDGPDGLEVVNVARPDVGVGDVLVKVEAAGINYFETLMLSDSYAQTPELPARLGVEIAGTVESVGPGVSSQLIDTRVAIPLFVTDRPFGGYSEFAAGPADLAVPIPDRLSSEEAVALLVQGLTALHAARQVGVAGKTILVTAATGGVGSILLQLLRRQGAKTLIGCVGSDEKIDLARRLGADLAVNYQRADWSGEVIASGSGVDLIFDFVGGKLTRQLLELLADGGELVFGALGRLDLQKAMLEDAIGRNIGIRGFALLPHLARSDVAAEIRHLFELAAGGAIGTIVKATFPLEDADLAHRAILNRRTSGKVVLSP